MNKPFLSVPDTIIQVFTAVIFLAVTWLPCSVESMELSGSAATFLGYYQDNFYGIANDDHATLSEYLSLNLTGLAEDQVSFHFYGSGMLDFLEKDNNDANLLFGYGQFRTNGGNLTLRAGRLLHLSSPYPSYFDGLSLRAEPGEFVSIDLFGGAEVRTDYDVSADDSLFGGRLAVHPTEWIEAGVHGFYGIRGGEIDRELAGLDMAVDAASWLSIDVSGSYDLLYRDLADLSALIVLLPSDSFDIQMSYSRLFPNSLLGANSVFTVFSLSSIEELFLTVSWKFKKLSSFWLRGGSVIYDEGDNLVRLNSGVSFMIGERLLDAIRLEYHLETGSEGSAQGVILTAVSNPISDMTIQSTAHYFQLDPAKRLFLPERTTADFVFSHLLSISKRLNRDFSATISAEYGRTFEEEWDLRTLLKISWFFFPQSSNSL